MSIVGSGRRTPGARDNQKPVGRGSVTPAPRHQKGSFGSHPGVDRQYRPGECSGVSTA